MSLLRAFRLVCVWLLIQFQLVAQNAPKLLPFQGLVTDSAGVPISDGVRVIRFRISESPVDNAFKWPGELHRASVNKGVINVLLGSKTSLDAVDFGKPMYLEVTVDGNQDGVVTDADPPMLPRQAILPVLFAHEAENSRKLGGYDWSALFGINDPTRGLIDGSRIGDLSIVNGKLADASVTSRNIKAGTMTTAALADGAVTTPKLADKSVTAAKIGDGAIQTPMIADGSITVQKMAPGLREDPPLMVTVGAPDVTSWAGVEVDIQQLCADGDGCTVRLILQHEAQEDQVRTIEMQLALEDPELSNNQSPGVYGWRRWGESDSAFILGRDPNLRYTLLDPWLWIYGTNFRPANINGGVDGPANTGGNTYRIWFMVHPHVKARVIIYDR